MAGYDIELVVILVLLTYARKYLTYFLAYISKIKIMLIFLNYSTQKEKYLNPCIFVKHLKAEEKIVFTRVFFFVALSAFLAQ